MTDIRPTSLGRVAHWRLAPEFWDRDVVVVLPALNPIKNLSTLIYPPLEGQLPAYVLESEDTYEKEMFKEWVMTLSVEDQEKVRVEIKLVRR